MHCSIAIVASDTGYVYLEASDKWFEDWLTKDLLAMIDTPSCWERVRRVFRGSNHEPQIRLAIRKTLQEFKNETSRL